MRSSGASTGHSPALSPSKKDLNIPQTTPLERHIQDVGPLREDGSDKFWGLENFGNTCYANSILQCLYYSVPFRQHVIEYPSPTPFDSVINSPTGQQRVNHNIASLPLNHPSLTYAKLMNRQTGANGSARNPAGPPTVQKPEDKEHPDYKKKVAQARGPSLAMNYDNATAYDMPESLFTSMKDIFEALCVHQSRIGVVSPSRFLDILKRDNEMFRTAMHQDAHEFLNLLLNDVVENVERHSKKLEEQKHMNGSANTKDILEQGHESAIQQVKQPSSWVHDLFEGTLTSETRCLTCENISQRDEVFLDLSVDLEDHSSVTSCLRKFSEEEMLCERNKFHCDNCGGLQEAEKRMKIKRLPKILALHLKRFKFTDDFQRLQKLFHRVVYPYHLRLFNTTDDTEDPDRLYELYAVVVHIGGGPYHGHYVSIIKTEDRGWLLFDDELVEPVDKSFVQNFFGDRPGLACAYVLFYRETTVEAVRHEQEMEDQLYAARAMAAPKELSPKELTGLSLMANGILGGLHPVKSARSPPLLEEVAQNLEKVVSEPVMNTAQSTQVNGDLTALPPIPTSGTPTDDAKSKKERQKEEKEKEKERRAAARQQAKEEERAEKERRRVQELQRRELSAKQDAEAKNPNVASKPSRNENDQPAADNGGDTVNGATGGLSRFKNSSKSFRKPKFLTGHKVEPVVNGAEGNTANSSTTADASEKQGEIKVEKSKNRFSALRKKTSNMML